MLVSQAAMPSSSPPNAGRRLHIAPRHRLWCRPPFALHRSGFGAFKALSPEVCRPFDAARCGLNLGEAAATLILSRTDGEVHDSPSSSSAALSHRWTLRSGCVRNDANHISGPSRTGEGVYRALCATLGVIPKRVTSESLEDLQENPPQW